MVTVKKVFIFNATAITTGTFSRRINDDEFTFTAKFPLYRYGTPHHWKKFTRKTTTKIEQPLQVVFRIRNCIQNANRTQKG
jgi:hypothetical protein